MGVILHFTLPLEMKKNIFYSILNLIILDLESGTFLKKYHGLL